MYASPLRGSDSIGACPIGLHAATACVRVRVVCVCVCVCVCVLACASCGVHVFAVVCAIVCAIYGVSVPCAATRGHRREACPLRAEPVVCV